MPLKPPGPTVANVLSLSSVVRVLGELLHLHGLGLPVHHLGLRLLQVCALQEADLHKLRPGHLTHRYDGIHPIHSILAH